MTNNQNNEGFIPVHGGYRNLMTYQKSEIIYDGTVYFTGRFFHKYSEELLMQQIRSLEIAFVNEGGLRERMTKARLDKRNKR